jgi:hypothetical protein
MSSVVRFMVDSYESAAERVIPPLTAVFRLMGP